MRRRHYGQEGQGVDYDARVMGNLEREKRKSISAQERSSTNSAQLHCGRGKPLGHRRGKEVRVFYFARVIAMSRKGCVL